MLPKEDYLKGVRLLPLIAIDFLIVNKKNELLLGIRKNRPAKGFYFTLGGSIKKNETFEQAWDRVCTMEFGTILPRQSANLQGIFHQHYDDNLGEEPFSTVYHTHAFLVHVDTLHLKHDEQHESLEWVPLSAIESHPKVHDYVKDYFRKDSKSKWHYGK